MERYNQPHVKWRWLLESCDGGVYGDGGYDQSWDELP